MLCQPSTDPRDSLAISSWARVSGSRIIVLHTISFILSRCIEHFEVYSVDYCILHETIWQADSLTEMLLYDTAGPSIRQAQLSWQPWHVLLLSNHCHICVLCVCGGFNIKQQCMFYIFGFYHCLSHDVSALLLMFAQWYICIGVHCHAHRIYHILILLHYIMQLCIRTFLKKNSKT